MKDDGCADLQAQDNDARSLKAPTFAFGAALLFGASTPFAKALLGTVDPWLMAGLLYAGAGIGLLSFRLIAGAVVSRSISRNRTGRFTAEFKGFSYRSVQNACATWRCSLSVRAVACNCRAARTPGRTVINAGVDRQIWISIPSRWRSHSNAGLVKSEAHNDHGQRQDLSADAFPC